MNPVLASARHEVLSTWRSRTAHILLYVFIGMVLVSSFIGWTTNRTVTSVYDQISAEGLTDQPNPFLNASPLNYARNAIIYVILIGALMAMVIGAQSTLRDRKAGTSALVLSRPISTVARLFGQLAGSALVLAAVLAISFFASWVSIGIIDGAVLGPEGSARLTAFALLSWVLLLGFLIIGMLAGLVSRNETSALLVPFVIWSAVAFVLPQIGTAARPVALLNPVPHPPATGGYFDVVAAITSPFAITEQFKRASGDLLQDRLANPGDVWASAYIVAFFVLMLVILLVTPRDRLRRPLDD
jgi:ABC-2 type transport system permease protein